MAVYKCLCRISGMVGNMRFRKVDETMKNYTITVNGTVYDVTVEEGKGSAEGGT